MKSGITVPDTFEYWLLIIDTEVLQILQRHKKPRHSARNTERAFKNRTNL